MRVFGLVLPYKIHKATEATVGLVRNAIAKEVAYTWFILLDSRRSKELLNLFDRKVGMFVIACHIDPSVSLKDLKPHFVLSEEMLEFRQTLKQTLSYATK